MNAALAVAVGGLVTFVGSLGDWAVCSTTPCYGDLVGQAFSEMSGLDFGYGGVTAIAAILLIVVGIDARRHGGASRFGTTAILLALLVLVTVSAFVVRVYLIYDESFNLREPPAYGTVLAGCGGLISLAAGLLMRRGNLNRDALK